MRIHLWVGNFGSPFGNHLSIAIGRCDRSPQWTIHQLEIPLQVSLRNMFIQNPNKVTNIQCMCMHFLDRRTLFEPYILKSWDNSFLHLQYFPTFYTDWLIITKYLRFSPSNNLRRKASSSMWSIFTRDIPLLSHCALASSQFLTLLFCFLMTYLWQYFLPDTVAVEWNTVYRIKRALKHNLSIF